MDSIKEMIKNGMARAFFGSSYADQADEAGQPLRGEIMDQLPVDIDPAAIHAADTLLMGLETEHKADIETLYALNNPEHVLDPMEWGHYAAMQAMGHGVGLFDYDIDMTVPYVEFGAYSLEKDYF